MFKNHMLKKMGYKKGDVKNLNVKDILELGKMGYSKEEIENLKSEEKPELPEDFQTQLDSLTDKINKLTQDFQSVSVRESKTDTDIKNSSFTDDVSEILQKMAGGSNEGN